MIGERMETIEAGKVLHWWVGAIQLQTEDNRLFEIIVRDVTPGEEEDMSNFRLSGPAHK